MKVKHLEACGDFLSEHGIVDLRSREAYSVMIDYAYSHRVGCDPDDFVAEMRRWHRKSAKSTSNLVRWNNGNEAPTNV